MKPLEKWPDPPDLIGQKKEALGQAEELLFQIEMFQREIATLEKRADDQIEEIRKRFGRVIGPLREKLGDHERDLLTLTKKNKATLFDGGDKVDLTNGVLLFQEGYKVKIPRKALELIEAEGWMDGIKIAKSVDRDVVEKWPEERLAVIGAEKRRTENFSYEIKADL